EGSQQFIYRTSLSKPATTPSQLTGRSSVEGKSLSTQSPAVSAPVPNGRTPAANRQNIVSKGSPSVPEGSRTFQPNQPSLLEQRTAQPGQSTPADRVNPRKNSKSPEKTTALPGARAIEQTPAPTLVRPPAPAAVSVPATLKPTVQSPTIIREQRSGNDRSLNQPQSNPPARQPNAQPLADSRPQVQYTPRITQPVQTQRHQIPTTPAPAPRVESAPARSTPPASNNNSGRNDDGNAGQGGKSGKGRDR
ncbi:MAG: hypothetical protein HY301_08000, partial [Verrucomicrobia bacterium]|nr:hypothetical protein [Verrucomicrobiota bacterium]